MKIINPVFFDARKDKKLNSFLVIQRAEKLEIRDPMQLTYMRLCIYEKEKYSNKENLVFIETDTEIRIENYSHHGNLSERSISVICFQISVYREDCHIRTFLNAIKKESDVKFRVVAFNGCDYHREKQLVSHQLYGIVDNRSYLLSSYTGADNSASPVR